MDFITPVIIGIIGSLLYTELGGPMVVALSEKKQKFMSKIFEFIKFHSGRVFIFGLIGVFFGMLGRGLRLAGFQQWTSILLGSSIIVSVFYPVLFKEQINLAGLFSGFAERQKVRMRKLLNDRSFFSQFRIGILIGLLPFGLVYLAIAGAINTGNVWTGSFYMILFGIGTIPLMLITKRVGNEVGQRIRLKMQRIVPYLVFMLGLLFILRGMSFGIPFISPTTDNLTPKLMVEKGCCCK